MNKTPHNRVAVVTGAARGIGRAAADALLADGWRVVYTGRQLPALQAAIDAAGDPFGDIATRALALPADVADPASVHALFDTVQARFGRLDFLFNNAGINTPAVDFEDLPFETWQNVIATNLTGAFLCSQQAFRLMKAQTPRGGRIVNNGSLAAYVPRPHTAAYAASKAAITGLTKACALDGREHDIAVGQIDIGNAATDMTQRMAAGIKQPDGSIRVEACMDVRHVGESIVHMANLPLDANVLTMTVMATKMPYVGRG